MSVVTQSVIQRAVTSKNCKITHLSMPLADTEYSLTLQSPVFQIHIVSKTKEEFKLAFKPGESGTNFWRVPRGNNYSLMGLEFTDKILYVQSSYAAQELIIKELY